MNKIINTVLLFGILCAMIYIGLQLKSIGYGLDSIGFELRQLADY